MSLDYTFPQQLYQVLYEKSWYEFTDDVPEVTTWKTAKAAGTAAEQAVVSKISDRSMSIEFSNAWLPNWATVTSMAYVQKYSGVCFQDMSSGKGGFCLLENNDTDMTGGPVEIFQDMNPPSSTTTLIVAGQTTNQKVDTYRLSEA
jgi:hypothetical protein